MRKTDPARMQTVLATHPEQRARVLAELSSLPGDHEGPLTPEALRNAEELIRAARA